ncbi:neuropeptides capa receptor [Biomphalaria glabrata]|uniref:Neuropeptides capa receptor-like n=1 Tax=Biomphalaria glabrata TaxID=6526 RepID=A0A9U8E7M2_BIOGL|nr:neuropeptides capa receptor-like [Biomphalaria glabrata]KAI8727969.1 neuropeptides capa receptor-like [Biomphalaria glabrata]
MDSSNSTFSVKIVQTTIVSPILLKAVIVVNFFVFTEAIGLFGIVANVVNIVNLRRQGFRDGFNITLTALAVSDLGILVTQQIYIQIYNPWTDESLFAMLKSHMMLFVIYANDYFVRVSGLITSFGAFERCLCVVLPMKVKLVVTRKTSTFVNVSIFLVLIGYVVLPYSLMYVGWKYIPNENKTIAYVFFKENRNSIMNLFYIVAGIFLPYFTILMLLVFTVILISKLRSKSEWRQRVSTQGRHAFRESDSVSYKERKVTAMLSAMSGLYVVCLLPHSALNLAMGLVDGMKIYGIYYDITTLAYTFVVLAETVNCSLTPIIYFKMSSKYREITLELLRCKKK